MICLQKPPWRCLILKHLRIKNEERQLSRVTTPESADRLVDDSALRTHNFCPVRNGPGFRHHRISTTTPPNNSPQQTTFSGTDGGLSASVDDNVGLRVIMPTETEKRYYRHGAGGQLKGIRSLTFFINPKQKRQTLASVSGLTFGRFSGITG